MTMVQVIVVEVEEGQVQGEEVEAKEDHHSTKKLLNVTGVINLDIFRMNVHKRRRQTLQVLMK